MEDDNIELGVLELSEPMECNTIVFYSETQEEPMLKLCANGDIFISGRKAENDIEVVEGMREFLRQQGLYKMDSEA